MAEFSNNDLQTVNPGESVVFTNNPVPCNRGFVQHRDDTGNFQLSGWTPVYSGCNCGCRKRNAVYLVDFGANVAIPTGETVGEISLAITIDGTTIPSSQMIVTPAAVEQFFNVSRDNYSGAYHGNSYDDQVIEDMMRRATPQERDILMRMRR